MPGWADGETGKRMLLILFFSNTAALILFLTGQAEAGRAGMIQRNPYGGGSRSETYAVTVGKELEKEEVVVDVEEQQYTSKEIREIFKQVTKELDEVILGENESLDHVEKDLNLLTRWKDYPIEIQWEADNYDVVDFYGKIQQEKTKKEGTLVELKGTLTYGDEEALYVTSVMVYPETKDKTGRMLEEVQALLKEEEENTREKETFYLPQKMSGQNIRWEKKKDRRGYYVLLLGGVGAVFMIALKKQNEQKAQKERQAQMLTDYPEIINKFTLLLSTGMTVKNVWERIVKNYEEQKPVLGVRAAYEEMGNACYEMQGGFSETEVYERFGRRCGLPVYVKFGAMLSQNIKKGAKGMTELLRMESVQAFENRKSRARRLGEEAGTRLLVPMFGMLAVVLVIVVVPAFLSMQL